MLYLWVLKVYGKLENGKNRSAKAEQLLQVKPDETGKYRPI
jgi:hypothetical protein